MVMDLIAAPICLMDSNGRIVKSNVDFKVFTGIEVEGERNIMEIICREDADRFFSSIIRRSDEHEVGGVFRTKMLIRGQSIRREYRWTARKDISADFYLVTAYPVVTYEDSYDEDDDDEYTRRLIDDMFAKLERRKNLQGLEQKEQKVERRKQNRTTKDLETIERLRKTLETKRLFVRNVGHEIRTPLHIVMSGLELLRSPGMALSPDALDIITDMKGACSIAIDILNDLLTYEKLDSDLLVLEKSPCDIKGLITKEFDLFRVQAAYAKLNMNFENLTSSVGLVVYGDKAKLSQVFRNLISNAIKFTPSEGSVTMTLMTLNTSKRVRIEVQDTGAGMSREQRERLFQEVVQFNAKELQNGQGSGLGLFLSRKIVDMHDGTIGVDMDWEGPGSKFYVELPIADLPFTAAGSTPDHSADTDDIDTTISGVAQEKYCVLIVDDTPLIRKFHRRMLLTYNVDCEDAENGLQAVQKVKESLSSNQHYDAILMDAVMPLLNGLDACKMLRLMGYSGKIFGVTGNAYPEDIDDFLAHGADEVFVKPVSMTNYYKIVNNI